MLFNTKTPLGLLRQKQLLQQQGLMADPGSAFQGVAIPGMSMPQLMGTVAPQGPAFPAMQPPQGLMSQDQPQQAPVEDQSTGASAATIAGLDTARKEAAGPSLDDRVLKFLNSPLLQMGVNLMGSQHSLNPWGDALNSTLGAQNQMQAMQQRQQQIDMQNRLGMGNLALGQQRMQNEVPLMQAQTGLATAQTGATTAGTQMDQQRLLMAQQQMARQNAIMGLVGQQLGGGAGFGAGLFGQPDPSQGQPAPQQAVPPQQGQPPPAAMPPPQNAPTMQPGVFSPSGSGGTGTYGTPSTILDGLGQTESSGNPNAVNPESGAIGLYQFLPQTVQMLGRQGMNFDPKNPAQARDAADFYLQTLQQKNGGDWKKTLADYGGFKTKDPSGYIQKVVDNGNAAQGGPTGPQPSAGPIPVSGPNQGMKMAQLGALAGLAGVPGAAGMVDLGKMMQPQSVQAGGYQYDPAKGTYGFMPDPYKAADTALKTRQVANETAKTGMDLGNNETKRATTQANDTNDYRTAVNGLDRLSSTTDELLKHPGLEDNTGWMGALKIRSGIPGSPAKDASVLLENLKSKLLVNTLADLKKASQNGASGFGQLSEKEGEELQTYVVNLDRAQSFDQMKTALSQIKNFADTSKGNFTDRYNTLYGKGGAGVASSIGATPAASPAPSSARASAPAPAPMASGVMSPDEYRQKHGLGRVSNQEMTGKIR